MNSADRPRIALVPSVLNPAFHICRAAGRSWLWGTSRGSWCGVLRRHLGGHPASRFLRWGNDAEGNSLHLPSHRPPDGTHGIRSGVCRRPLRAARSPLGVRPEQLGHARPALQEGSHFDVIIAGLERSPENLAKIDA